MSWPKHHVALPNPAFVCLSFVVSKVQGEVGPDEPQLT